MPLDWANGFAFVRHGRQLLVEPSGHLPNVLEGEVAQKLHYHVFAVAARHNHDEFGDVFVWKRHVNQVGNAGKLAY